jgi:DNA-binding transcriptional LysR family regulator
VPTFKQLYHATELARHGNFRDAAAAARITQPALTRSIQALEADLGVKLFDRRAGAVEATTYGAIMLRRARSLLAEGDDLRNEIDRAAGLESGRFSVSAGALPAGTHAALAVARLVNAKPGITCQLRQESWLDVIARVVAREADVGVAETSIIETDARIQTEVVATPRFAFYCRTGHPLQARRSLTVADVFNFPIASTRAPRRIATAIGIAESRGGSIDPVSGDFVPAIEVQSIDAAQRIVAESDAVGASLLMQIEDGLDAGRLAVIDWNEDWMHLNYGFIYLRDRTLSPAANLFMQEFRRVALDVTATERVIRARFGLEN